MRVGRSLLRRFPVGLGVVLWACGGAELQHEEKFGSDQTPPPAYQEARYWTRYEPELVDVRAAGGVYRFSYERGLQEEKARTIEQFFRERYPYPYGGPSIYRVPTNAEQYLVSWFGETWNDNYGLRFYLVRLNEEQVEVISETRGQLDSEWLQPVFFARGDSALILSDTGSEYSWGVAAFEHIGGRFHELGMLNVAAPPTDTLIGWTTNPLPHVRVTTLEGAYVVEFATDLVYDPGGRDEQDWKREGGRPISLIYQGDAFVRQ